MLQAILDGQTALKEELKGEINRVETKVDDLSDKVEENGARLDKLGLQLAELSDDAPTNEEFDNLDGRVTKLERQFTKN
jgi:polyhydroxyalkanoate synthesis regulator phasin